MMVWKLSSRVGCGEDRIKLGAAPRFHAPTEEVWIGH